MNTIAKLMMESISAGLGRRAADTCSKWTQKYRIMKKPFPGPWSFKYHPWLREMHDSPAEFNVGQKAAQMGFTEWALNKTFYKIDVESIDCLYILPSESDASDFSSGRFDPALSESPYLSNLFADVSNVGHKRTGSNNLYVRGSRSRSKMKSIPCGFIVFDEVDEMFQDNIPLAMERSAGQMERQILMISTPTLFDLGINAWFNQSTKEHFFFPCPHCGRQIEFTYPECLVITAEDVTDRAINNSYLCCPLCKAKLEHETKHEYLAKGQFVPEHTDRDIRGFHVPQFYSSMTACRPGELAKSALKALKDPTEATEWFNSKLGLVYEADGARINDSDIQQCMYTHKKGHRTSTRPITMGIDVGKELHIEIDEWFINDSLVPGLEINDQARPRVIFEGTTREFTDLDKFMRAYGVWFAVCDRQPEMRNAFQFATRFWGRVLLCMYGQGITGKQLQEGSESERTVTVDRTSWLDLSLSRFKNKEIFLPMDTSNDYKTMIKDPIRVYEKDKDGNPVGRYVTKTDRDHFAHARNYAEIALPFAFKVGESQNISGAY